MHVDDQQTGFVRTLTLARPEKKNALTVAMYGWSIGTFAEPLLLGGLNEQRTLAWTLYQRGVVSTDYGVSATMGIVLLVVAFVVTYFSLRYSRGALVE